MYYKLIITWIDWKRIEKWVCQYSLITMVDITYFRTPYFICTMQADSFKLIILTPDKNIAGETGTINSLFQNGLQTLHVRKPNHTRNEIKNLLLEISKDFHSRIVIHQHYELLNDFNLKGAHLPENRRKEGETKGIRNIISTSFHKLDDIIREKAIFEYAFFSPVFKSISKKGHKSSVDTYTLRIFFQANKAVLNFPIIALGGINEVNSIQAKEIGFGGVACIGYIWENPKPVEEFIRLQKILQG
jgi:thiamine-phosphate pyrophosphorylase